MGAIKEKARTGNVLREQIIVPIPVRTRVIIAGSVFGLLGLAIGYAWGFSRGADWVLEKALYILNTYDHNSLSNIVDKIYDLGFGKAI